MKVTKKLLREYIQKLIKESMLLPQSVTVGGKSFLVVNSLTHMEQLTDLLIQAQDGGSAGFGNFFEDVVIEAFPGQYTQLNDGGGGPFPFADLYKDDLNGLAFYSVKMKRLLDDSTIGGGAISPHQLRSMLQHETTVNQFSNVDIRPGLISAALEPTFFEEAKKVGLPIKIQIINPVAATPAFKLEPNPNATTNPKIKNKGILAVKSRTEEYAKQALGTGINQSGFLNPTLTYTKNDGYYRINGNDNIFNESLTNPSIVNDPTVQFLNTQLTQLLTKNGFASQIDYEKWKKSKAASKRQLVAGQEGLIDAILKAYESAQRRVRSELEEPIKPSKTATKTYDLFNENIMENTGRFEEPVYLLVTGGFSRSSDVKATLQGRIPTMPNIKSLIKKVEQVLDFQVSDLKDKGRSLGRRLIAVFSRQSLISEIKSRDTNKDFPDGFFIAIVPTSSGTSLGYFDPAHINFPFELIPSQNFLDNLRKYERALAAGRVQNDPEYDQVLRSVKLSSLPKKHPGAAKINKNKANKMLIQIAVDVFVNAIDDLKIPFKRTATPQKIEEFKRALREFNLLKKISDDSKGETILSEGEVNTIDDNIDNFRSRIVLPLARKVLPASARIDGKKLTQKQIIKRLGILSEVFSTMMQQEPFDIGQFEIDDMDLPVFEDELYDTTAVSAPEELIEDPNTAKPESVLGMLFNMADLLTTIIEVGIQYPAMGIDLLKGSLISERKKADVYQKIILELLKNE